jgi:hypothetical protein
MSDNRIPSPAEPKWRFIERTVVALEHMLAPGAVVLHDQRVPELVSGIERQCDVVVWYGKPPRRTLAAIAEVQAREDKIGLQDFEGWCSKREKLDAQRLICVSCEGFTEDVQKSAAALGDMVSLMTLCEADQRPPFLAGTGFSSHLQVLHWRDAKVVFKERMPSGTFLVKDEIFEFPENGRKISLDSLGTLSLRRGLAKDVQRCRVDDALHDLNYKVQLGTAGRPLLLTHQGQRYFVEEVLFTDRMEEVHQGLDPTPLAYEQMSINGVLAWVLLSKGSYHGKEFYTQQSFRQLPNGRIEIGGSTMSKIEGMHSVIGYTCELVLLEVPVSS